MEIDSIHHQAMFLLCNLYHVASLYSRNTTHKYVHHMANNSIQIYYVYNHISLIDLCLNYSY